MLGRKMINVPYIDQTKEWPTGCESVSAVMLLQYLGADLDVGGFVHKYLEKEPFEKRDNMVLGADPRVKFAGSPEDPESMGCYAPVICRALKKVLGEGKVQGVGPSAVKDLTNAPMPRLLSGYIDRDMPVIFWASLDLKKTVPGPCWTIRETGELFSWVSNEHCMLLVGYDETHYYFNDPWHDHGVIGYDRFLTEKRHAEQYSMAVSIEMC